MLNSNARKGLAAGLLLLTVFLTQCSMGGLSAKRSRSGRDLNDASSVAVWRPTLKNDVPDAMNASVQKWIDLFQGRFKSNFDRWFSRLGQYGPTIESTLVKEGVPKDLIYLAMIESGFNLQARSHAAAVGPWQFIGSTGRMYGLHNDFFMDDRSDLVHATQAAARHLKDLYKTYGDWYLAFAAYNAGPGTVNGAIRRTGSSDFWTHARSRYYRQETKDYVPKILAARHIVKNYAKYGYSARNFASPLQYDRVTVPDATDLATIAKSANTDVEVIRQLNPALTSGITRPGHEVAVYIPKGSKDLFARRYATIPEDERVSGLYHKVGYRETLASIARHYGVNKNRLAKINQLSPNQAVSPGQVVRVPADRKLLLAMANHSLGSSNNGSWAVYRVRRGDTLGKIARQYRTSTQKLASWNNLRGRSALKIGQRLKIYQASGGGSAPSGLFYAAKPGFVPAAGRMSGVAHIIAKDQQDPVDLGMTHKEAKSMLPKMVALSSEIASASADQPSVVKMFDEPEADEQEVPSTDSLIAARAKATKTAVSAGTVRGVPATFHVVKAGETLSQIAARYRISVGALKQLNRLASDTVRVNQRLTVQQGRALVAKASPAQALGGRSRTLSSRMIVHQTRSGDTLWKISKRYGVKVTDIKKWNSLRGDSLKPNQKLRIYAAAARPVGRKVALVKS